MIKLRLATINDLELPKYWNTQQHVIECDPDGEWNWEIELKRNPMWKEQFFCGTQWRDLWFSP